MKTSFSGLTLQSKTLSSFPNRKRIFSLKSVIRKGTTQTDDGNEKKVLLKLERALDKDNEQYSQHIAEPQSKIPGFEQLAIDHKLWKYFQSRMKTVKDKVERQQVNCCEKQFAQIKNLVSRRRDAHKFNLISTQKLIKDKYKQITSLFDEIKQQKIIKLNNSSKTTSLMPPFANTQKLTLFKENIENIRLELNQLESQMKLELQEEEKLVKEWISLLVHIVREGFFMEDGVRSVLKEMGRVQYVPAKNDFPGFIDQTTFNCFIRIYQDVKKEQEAKMQTEKQGRRRQVSSSIKNIRQIAKRPDLKKIYEGTREYMLDWLKNESWKENCTLPKIKQKVQIISNHWQEQQRKRMKIVYEDKEKLRIIKKMLFGPKVQIIQ